MSNRTARPFEAGDLVLSENYGVGVVESIGSKICCDGFSGDFNQHYYGIDGIERLKNEKRDVIKTIRKPRKGSKEARDIVAKIGWMYLMDYKKSKKAVFNSEEYHYFLKRYSSKQQCYLVAKSMLK